jgi:hypothetical protein
LLLARARCAKIIAAHEAMLAQTDRILAAEDAAEAQRAAGGGGGGTEEPAAAPAPEAAAEIVAPDAPVAAT